MDQVHLPQIGLARITGHTRAMFDRHPHMRVALHAEPREQPDARLLWLDQRMGTTLLHRLDDPAHCMLLLPCPCAPHHPRCRCVLLADGRSVCWLAAQRKTACPAQKALTR